jgi:hypothetical protein
LLEGLARKGHDAEKLTAMLADGRVSEQVATLLRIFDGGLVSRDDEPRSDLTAEQLAIAATPGNVRRSRPGVRP